MTDRVFGHPRYAAARARVAALNQRQSDAGARAAGLDGQVRTAMEDAARTLALGDEPDLDAIVRLQGLLGRARLELTIVAKALDLAIHQLGAAERAARDELAAAARGRGLIVRGVR